MLCSIRVLYCLCFVSLSSSSGEWHPGKIPAISSDFDLLDLNGRWRPEDAVKICDKNVRCAGFTFKGLANTTNVKQKDFETYFFSYVYRVTASFEYANWMSYISDKAYAIYKGSFSSNTFIKYDTQVLFGVGKQTC